MRSSATLALVVSILGAVSCEKKQVAAVPPATQNSGTANAATVYVAVGEKLEKPFVDRIKELDPSTVNEEVIRELDTHASEVASLLAASRIDSCDFGLPVETMDTLRPHLAKCRESIRLLRADGVRCIAQGDGGGAAQRAAAIARMSLHLYKQSECCIDLLVASAASQTASNLIEKFGSVQLPAAEKQDLLAALDALDFSKAHEPVVNDIRLTAKFVRTGDGPADYLATLEAATAQQRAEAASALEALANDLPSLWDMDHPEFRITERFDKLPPLAQRLMPAISRVRIGVRDNARLVEVAKKRLN